MNIKDYFDKTDGIGVLATADSSGNVDAALYERPNFVDEENISFIMTDQVTHRDLETNPHAAYLFTESGSRSKGTRLYLTKTREEKDSPAIDKLLQEKRYSVPGGKDHSLYLVYFHIDNMRNLIEDGERA